jgi:cell division protein FtsL
MTANTSEHILVILLSVALAVLLFLAIVIAVYAIRLLKAVNRIAEKAEHVAQKAEGIGELLSKVTTSTAAFRVAKSIFDMVKKRTSTKP